MGLTGAQAVVQCLEQEGVEFIFGMIGHGNLALFDALHDSNIRLIAMPHEQLAGHAADGYYRISHKPGVITASIGPGFANTVNGVLDAAEDSSAMVIISGDTPTGYIGFESFQELSEHSDASQWEILRPIVKRAWHVQHPKMLTQAMARAFNYAVSGRPGPVLVNVAFDLFSRVEDYHIPDMTKRRPSSIRVPGPPSEIERAIDLLWNAERPLIYAGNGVNISEASNELIAMAEHLSAPVATTMTAPDVMPTDHPLYGGFTGTVGTETGNWLAQNTDVVLALGTRFGEMDTNSWRTDYFFPADVKIIQIDIEPQEIGKVYNTEVGIIGDVKAVLNQLLAAAQEKGAGRDWQDSAWVQTLKSRQQEWHQRVAEIRESEAVPIEVARVLKEVRDALPEDGYLIAGVGPRHMAAQQFPVYHPNTIVINNGHGTMGFGPPAALGVKLAKQDKTVIAVVGDGEFRSVSQILAPAVEHGVNVIWVILNNYGFNIIELYQKRHYERMHGTRFQVESTGTDYNPDFVKMAEAYGAGGAEADTIEELQQALQTAIAEDRPYVIDVRVTRQPRILGSGFWDANMMLPLGYNV
ncbi:MAG: thiamine pyrophosphate-binding protein [Chloroflexota bacterium]